VSIRGVLQVHSAPPALCPHIEWAAAGVVGVPVSLGWVAQPAEPGMMRAGLDWEGRPGTAGDIASALAGWNRLRFEVSEEASPGCDAVRYSYTPDLGMFSATMMANGDVAIPENRLRAAVTVAEATASGAVGSARRVRPGGPPERPRTLAEEIAWLLGEPWDSELEPFRCAADGAPVRWLHATG